MSSEALAKPIITRNSSEFKADAYASIPAGELVVFAVQLVQADTAPVAVEEVVSTCFRLFPHSFSLKNYFYWPDSALVTRRLHDAKEKGLLKGSPAEGFEVKGRGTQLAKRIAKALGVTLPMPPKVEPEPAKEVPVPVLVETAPIKLPEAQLPLLPEMKETPKKEPVKAAAKKPVVKKKATPAKAKKEKKEVKPITAAPNKKVSVKKTVTPKAEKKAPAKKAVTPAPKKKTPTKKAVRVVATTKTPEKKTTAPAPTKKVKARKAAAPALVKTTPKKKTPAPKGSAPKMEKKAPAPKKESPKPKAAQPAQLTLSLPATPPAKKTAERSAAKPSVKKETKPVKQETAPTPQVQISKEEKDKAGKFVKLMERSDAFQQYRKNGGKAKISEFDFRNMLYATMESSAETLKRNVDLFKRYAGIHNRADLITFLAFCEDSFAPLLMPQAKRTRNQK